MQPQQGQRQQNLQAAGIPSQQLAALQSLGNYGAAGYPGSYNQSSQSPYAQLALAQNPQLQAQIAQAQRNAPHQVQPGLVRPQMPQQQQAQQQQQQQQQQQRWLQGQAVHQAQRPVPRPPAGALPRMLPRAGPAPLPGQHQAGSKPTAAATQGAVRAAEASAAARRHKKRKATDKHMPEQVAQLVPESELYSNMLAVDRQVTSAINYKKARIREALQRPLRVPKRLRVIISSVPEHQNLPRFTPGAPGDDQLRDPPSWVLKVAGKVVDTAAPKQAGNSSENVPGAGPGVPPRPAQGETAPLMQHIKRLRVQLDETQYPGPQGVLDWDRARNAGEFKQQLEIRRKGNRDVSARISIELERVPEQWQLSEKLQSLVGRPLATKSHVLQALWAHVSSHHLQSASDPSLITCDPLLKALFGGSEPSLRLSSFTSRVSSHMFPAKPSIIDHTIRIGKALNEDCIEFDLELPAAAMNERSAPFLEAISKQGQIDQVDARIGSLLSKADEHRRRRAFFLAFSQSPVDFMNALIASQGRDLYAASKEGIPEFEALRRTDLFKGKWVEDAVLRYLHRHIATGA